MASNVHLSASGRLVKEADDSDLDLTTLASQVAAITDASTAHALNATFSDTEVEAALNALGTKLNSVLAALRAGGLVAT